jgi:hypothetical protein
MQIDLKIIKDGKISPHGMAMFCIVRDEIYFLPFLLEHYRRLGVDHFLFYDDGSNDGSLEFLQAQQDCAIITSSTPFGSIGRGGVRYCHVLKAWVPRTVFGDRWVLTVDADEFLLLPEPFVDLKALCAAIEREGGGSAVAAMVDLYPETLNLRNYPYSLNPFAMNRYFDRGPFFHWRQGDLEPARRHDGVRYRLADMLFEHHRADYIAIYGENRHIGAKLWKVPLVNHSSAIRPVGDHELNEPPFLGVQMALAHFKFAPNLDQKIEYALASKAYFKASREYRLLERVVHYFSNVPLLCERTCVLTTVHDLERANLLYPLGGQDNPEVPKASI